MEIEVDSRAIYILKNDTDLKDAYILGTNKRWLF